MSRCLLACLTGSCGGRCNCRRVDICQRVSGRSMCKRVMRGDGQWLQACARSNCMQTIITAVCWRGRKDHVFIFLWHVYTRTKIALPSLSFQPRLRTAGGGKTKQNKSTKPLAHLQWNKITENNGKLTVERRPWFCCSRSMRCNK